MKSCNEKSSSCNSTGCIKDEQLKTSEKAGYAGTNTTKNQDPATIITKQFSRTYSYRQQMLSLVKLHPGMAGISQAVEEACRRCSCGAKHSRADVMLQVAGVWGM